MTDDVIIEQRDRVLLITINRPDNRNAIDRSVSHGLADAVQRLDSDDLLSVGVVTGQVGNFCAGMDLKAFVAGENVVVEGRGLGLGLGFTLRPPTKPIIAAVEGFALAGGTESALACDLIVAARSAKFGLPEVKRGLVAGGGGLLRLPRRIPYQIALELALTGKPLSADDAHRYGLANRIEGVRGEAPPAGQASEPGGEMKFTLEYPSDLPAAGPEFLRPEVLGPLVRRAEAVGFSAIALSEHPAPSAKWRRNGGHDTLDPGVALGFVSAVTTSVRVMTHLVVLPFRNPYLSAKTLTSLDILSGGRLIAAVGAGYLRSEFAALGVDFGRRGELFDEALDALVRIWTEPEVPVQGTGFAAVGEMHLDRPRQRPHPPIWIGGTSSAALRRVVSHGTGWCPVIGPPDMAVSLRTGAIASVNDFRQTVTRLHGRLEQAGRDPRDVDIQVEVPHADLSSAAEVSAIGERIAEYGDAGATWVIVHVDGRSPQHAARDIDAFSELFISRGGH